MTPSPGSNQKTAKPIAAARMNAPPIHSPMAGSVFFAIR